MKEGILATGELADGGGSNVEAITTTEAEIGQSSDLREALSGPRTFVRVVLPHGVSASEHQLARALQSTQTPDRRSCEPVSADRRFLQRLRLLAGVFGTRLTACLVRALSRLSPRPAEGTTLPSDSPNRGEL